MWYLKNIIVFISIWSIGHVFAAIVSTKDWNYDFTNFSFNASTVGEQPAGKIVQSLNLRNPGEPILALNVMNRYKDSNLTVFAIPEETGDKCPQTLIGNENLRQYMATCPVFQDADEKKEIYFFDIFTGCYYFYLTTWEGDNWEFGPVFYNTTYHYYDTKLEYISKLFDPEKINSNQKLHVLIKIPLNCIEVRAQIFQFDKDIEAADDISDSKIPGSQEYWFSKMNRTVNLTRKGSNLTTDLALDVKVYSEKDNKWTALVTWNELQHGGGRYYLWFTPYISKCAEVYGHRAIETWKLVNGSIWLDLGYRNASNPETGTTPTSILSESNFVIICCISLSFIVIAILVFWSWKYLEVIPPHQLKSRPPEIVPKYAPLHDEKESRNILLMYARDSPTLMTEMRNLRNYLKQACDCPVYNLYAMDEWNMIRSLDTTEWIEQLLRDGCKIVWVDTPQLRYHLDRQQDQDIMNDHLDQAIPHAVDLAKKLFQNSTTQYLRHFVVRVEGLKVDDEHDDPLLLFTPYRRYYIPDHLDLLCEHLKNPTKRLENTKDGELERS